MNIVTAIARYLLGLMFLVFGSNMFLNFMLSFSIFRYLVMIESIKIKVRHQVGLNIINCFCKSLYKFVEVFLVQEDFVPVITIFIKFLTAFGNRQIIIIASCSPYIKKISPSFTGPDSFAIHAFHSFVIVLVRHVRCFR